MVARKWVSANAAALVLLTCPQLSLADSFTSADVLAWDEQSQESLIQTSITMINIVAGQTGDHDHVVNCINEWYGTAELQAQRHADILAVMDQYRQNHPQGIIMAVVEKACGQFDGG